MSEKTVGPDPEAYEMQRRQRRPGEIISEVVKRLSGRRPSILDYAGSWKEMRTEDLQKIESYIAEGKRRDRGKMQKLLEARSK